jgi:hypothetical protein
LGRISLECKLIGTFLLAKVADHLVGADVFDVDDTPKLLLTEVYLSLFAEEFLLQAIFIDPIAFLL